MQIVIRPLFKFQEAMQKSGQNNDSSKIFACIFVYLLLYQPLYDLTNPIANGGNLISVLGLVLRNALGHHILILTTHLDISSWSYQSIWLQTDISLRDPTLAKITYEITKSFEF